MEGKDIKERNGSKSRNCAAAEKEGGEKKSSGWVGIFQFITHIPLPSLLLSFFSRVSVFRGVLGGGGWHTRGLF